ncbi:DUF167 domain-containing protein [Cryobacterium psychrophilum]|uniref:DUF167 domain-containing protein n=1 Tax=Cryobacterium psychrophilum TaxID=41988 RepID=A0A4Y8KQS1_9MICO|nr:DUF167 domain-containing protein [Cryobacterium psychrophilum]TDW29078.1 hypothetical protein EDD25_0756 [Cryobacterium psychrophilum]TFD79710.1 DUF167 domain-containing protein [Cryobacterium psychrophilum]
MTCAVTLTVPVNPGSRTGPLVALPARLVGVARRDVIVVRGHTSRIRHVRLDRS